MSYCDDDEIRRLRLEEEDLDQTAGQVDPGSDVPPHSASFVGYPFSGGSYPTSAKAFYNIQPVRVSGTETEGGAATFTLVGNPVLALNTGSQIPAAGTSGTMGTNTYVLVTWVPNRFEFQYDG